MPDRIAAMRARSVSSSLERAATVCSRLGARPRLELPHAALAIDVPTRCPAHGRRGDQHDDQQESRRHRLRIDELVAELLHGHERLLEKGQLFSQTPDVDVDRTRGAGILVVPHVGQAADRARARGRDARADTGAAGTPSRSDRTIIAVVRHRVPLDVDADRPAAQDALLDRRAGRVRRSSARTRAISSFGLNGFTT